MHSQPSENKALNHSELPKEIHFIWIGGRIPKKYFLNIQKIASVAQRSGFGINLWVDNINNAQYIDPEEAKNKDYYRQTQLVDRFTIPNLKLRNIKELREKMAQDAFYRDNPKILEEFDMFMRREMIGLKNLAAVSDLLRLEILRQEGGYYLDTDTDYEVDVKSILEANGPLLKADAPPFGFLLHALFLPGEQREDFHSLNSHGGNNDIIASQKQHVFLKNAILKLLDNYKMLDRGYVLGDLELMRDRSKICHIIDMYDVYKTIIKGNRSISELILQDADKEILLAIKMLKGSGNEVKLNNLSTEEFGEIHRIIKMYDLYKEYHIQKNPDLDLEYEWRDDFKNFLMEKEPSLFLVDTNVDSWAVASIFQREINRKKELKTLMEKKREYTDNRDRMSDGRFGLTIRVTGPLVLINTAQEFYREYSREYLQNKNAKKLKENKDEMLSPVALCFSHKGADGHSLHKGADRHSIERVRVAGIVCIAKSDQTWMKKPGVKFFDDTEIDYSSLLDKDLKNKKAPKA